MIDPFRYHYPLILLTLVPLFLLLVLLPLFILLRLSHANHLLPS